jgi:RNA exonuclease 4
MNLKNLSSNWKKLQETLREASDSNSQAKRKALSEPQQNRFKKRRTGNLVPRNTEQHRYASRKGNMSEAVENTIAKDAMETVLEISSRYSTRPIPKQEPQNAKINEGLSPMSALASVLPFSVCKFASTDLFLGRKSANTLQSIAKWWAWAQIQIKIPRLHA